MEDGAALVDAVQSEWRCRKKEKTVATSPVSCQSRITSPDFWRLVTCDVTVKL